jgi:hypothetical protein
MMPPPAHLATQSASAIAKLNVATALHVAVDAVQIVEKCFEKAF